MSGPQVPPSERKIIFLLAAVSFVNILDFMMVMPLGPDFARDLGIATSRLGLIAGSYTLAAAAAGAVGAMFLDRFDRRQALAVAMLGLVTATAMGALAQGFGSLIAARVMAGLCGGPATAVSLAILADVVPLQRRGQAMGTVMGAFAAASVIGVFGGLELGRLGGWRLPFVMVALTGLGVVVGAIKIMPPFRGHLDRRGSPRALRTTRAFLADPVVLLSLTTSVVVFTGGFSVIPNLSAYLQYNLGYPRSHLGVLYLVGGVVSFVAMRIGGGVVDRRGPVPVTAAGTVLMMFVLAVGFLSPEPGMPVLLVFVGFMLANSLRGVAINTLSSKVPYPAERARFMSAQSTAQHLASSTGAIISSALLTERADGSLAGMDSVAGFALTLAASVPFLVWAVSMRLRRRDELAVPRAAE
jgi:predicted MFS family arabinose efflux permease